MTELVRKRLRIEGFDYSQGEYVFFATLCARHRGGVFANPILAQHVVDAIEWSRRAGRWKIYCYCLMPDHLHLTLSPAGAGNDLSWAFAAFKRWTTRKAWDVGLRGHLWQRSWYDHVARHEESLVRMCQYVLDNPVRKGLVEIAAEWLYSGTPDELPW